MNNNKKYKVGDRVRVITDVPLFIGQEGTVLGYKESPFLVIVELDKPYKFVQNLQTGKSYLSGTRYYLEEAIKNVATRNDDVL